MKERKRDTLGGEEWEEGACVRKDGGFWRSLED